MSNDCFVVKKQRRYFGLRHGSMPGEDYVHGMMEGVLLYGKHGFQTVGKDISADSYFAGLSEVDQQTALKLGQGLRELDTNEKVERVRKSIERAKIKKQSSSARRKGVRIVGSDGKIYENVVNIDKNSYNKIKRHQKSFENFVERMILTKKIPIVFDGDSIMVEFATPTERVYKDGAKNNHLVVGKLKYVKDSLKKQAVISVVRLIENSEHVELRKKNEHQWLDLYGWEIRKSYLLADDGILYPVELKIANSRDGRRILYDVRVEKETGVAVDKVATSKLNSSKAGVKSTTLVNNSIPQNSEIVKGKVFYDERINLDDLTEKQRDEIAFAGTVIAAIGNTVHFYNSQYAPKDSREARTNGWYDPKDGSIHLDIAKIESGEESVLFTLSHELVHFIEDWSPAKYETFANFLLKNYAEHGVATDQLVREKMAELNTTDYDYAMSELVADACERMLLDSNAAQKLAELNKTDKKLGAKIKDFFANVLKRIRNAYANYKGRPEAQYLQKMDDVLSELHALFEDALVDAARNYQDADGKLGDSEVREQAKKGLDKYTEKQYNNFGWASYNGVITAKEREVLLSRFADFKHNRNKYAITEQGEAVIYSFECPDVIMYVKGTIKSPEITKIIRITTDPQEGATDVAESVIENERRKAPLPLWCIEESFGQGILQSYNRSDVDSYSEYRRRVEGSSRQTNDSSYQTKQYTRRSFGVLSGIGEEFSESKEKYQRKLNSTREILVNVDLKTADLSKRGGDQLAAHLKDYQKKERELKKHEAKVRSLSEKILKMRHDREKGKPYVSSEMDALLTERNRETILASQVRRSMQLITTAPVVKDFVQREKLTAWRQNRDEIERGKMERVRVTELKQKARKKAETLNKMLTKPTKKIHVKSGLQKSVASFLYTLNLDTVKV